MTDSRTTSHADLKTYTSMDQVEQELFPVRWASRQRKCPACGAEPGRPCIAAMEQAPLRDPHKARIDAERAARTQGHKDPLA